MHKNTYGYETEAEANSQNEFEKVLFVGVLILCAVVIHGSTKFFTKEDYG